MTRIEVEKLVGLIGMELGEEHPYVSALMFALAGALVEGTEKDLAQWVDFYIIKKIEQYGSGGENY